jgi:hypothetical protein
MAFICQTVVKYGPKLFTSTNVTPCVVFKLGVVWISILLFGELTSTTPGAAVTCVYVGPELLTMNEEHVIVTKAFELIGSLKLLLNVQI